MKKLLIIGLLFSLPAWCVSHSLVLTGQTQSLTVQAGDTVDVVGDSNQISLSGDFASLNLTGSNNHIRVDGQLGSVNIVGSGNQISWVERSGRRAPRLSSLGNNNQVVAVKP